MRARLRIDESVSEARALRAEVSAWRARWDTIDAMGGHLTQLDLLTDVVLGLVDEITARSAVIDTIFFSADLTPAHPSQVARMVRETLDGTVPGAAAGGELTVAAMVPGVWHQRRSGRRLPSRSSRCGS